MNSIDQKRGLHAANDDAFHEIDDLLVYLTASRQGSLSNGDSSRKNRIPLSCFDGALVISAQDFSDGKDGLAFLPPRDFDHPSAIWPIDQKLVTTSKDRGDDNVRFQLTRVQTVTPKEVRSKVRILAQYMVRVTVGLLENFTGSYVAADTYYGWVGGSWRNLNFGGNMWVDGDSAPLCQKDENALDMDQTIRLAQSSALTERYTWSVGFRYPGTLMVRFATDPTGAREAFRMRDVEDGRERRSALRNWVSAHWRQLRSDNDEETKVRTHLRGATSFGFGGFECQVVPSRYDEDMATRSETERQQDRRNGTDRRRTG